MKPPDHYQVLRLTASATPKEIEEAYWNLSILYRDGTDALSKELMSLIDESHRLLQDPKSRAGYDMDLLTHPAEDNDPNELSAAEKVIGTWGHGFTPAEQEYIDKVHAVNRTIWIAILIGTALFIASVVTMQLKVALAIVVVLAILRAMIWLLYNIKNPPPPPEV